jgi:RES domain-containing protein
MVYLASSRALAALELLVHLTSPGSRKIPRTLVTVKVPLDLIGGELWQQAGWRDTPPGRASTDQGDDWLTVAKTAGVLVPSAIIPEEHNLLLNPNHPRFQEVRVTQTDPFRFDPRLLDAR